MPQVVKLPALPDLRTSRDVAVEALQLMFIVIGSPSARLNSATVAATDWLVCGPSLIRFAADCASDSLAEKRNCVMLPLPFSGV